MYTFNDGRFAMKHLLFMFLFLFIFSCKTTDSKLSSLESEPLPFTDTSRIENKDVRELWEKYVKDETEGKRLQVDCAPRFYPAEGEARKGVAILLHGFSACPQQFFAIASLVSKQGFDVFIPLLPGQGRMPTGDKDNLEDLPAKRTEMQLKKHPRYVDFVNRMNAIAKASTGIKVVSGLSGGGGLATGMIIAGRISETENLWDRALLFSPFYLNPGVAKAGADIAGFFAPGYVNDWGESCRINRSRGGKRNGYCSITTGAVQAMESFGATVAMDAAKINIPIQYVGVEKDPTADNRAMRKAYNRIPGEKNKRFCFYPLGVPHSIINPDQDLLPNSTEEFKNMRGAKTPNPPYYWVPSMQIATANFIINGEFFPSSGVSEIEKEYGNSFPICETKKTI